MKILGLMSGTSLDGVDLALCDIGEHGYDVVAADTVPYPAAWRERLAHLEDATALDYALADVELGHHYGRLVRAFLEERRLEAEAVASHGHTIFHRPDRGLTTQIGNVDAIAAECGLPVVGGFRTLDVALGGQGAPLVPIGDELLFPSYDACLNLGGFANISFRKGGVRRAFDISPCNMALDRLAAHLGLAYDPAGSNAACGHVHTCLKKSLDDLPYYALEGPKSLGKEWFVEQFWPTVCRSWPTAADEAADGVRDMLATVSAHIAWQTARVLRREGIATLLVTGGGAFNSDLVDRIAQFAPDTTLTVPDALTVSYKEAIIFALLGYLRLRGEANTLASVTGARCDSCGGNISGLLIK